MVSAHNNGEYLAEYVVLLLFHSDLQGMHWSCSSYTQALHKVVPGIAGRRAHEAKTLAAKEHVHLVVLQFVEYKLPQNTLVSGNQIHRGLEVPYSAYNVS
jgi:hypothetical protein